MNRSLLLSNRFIAIFVLLGLANFSCESATDSKEKTPDSSITNTKWELRYISENGFGVEAPPVDTLFSVTFDEEGGFTAKDYCNVCNGSYETSNGELVINNVACSLALCAQTKTDIQFGYELDKVTSYSFRDNELQLSYKENGLTRTLHLVDAEDSSPKKVILTDVGNTQRDNWENGSYNVELVSLVNDTVTLRVGYSGCNVKDVNMVFGNYFLESLPVQAHAFLPQVDEACLAYFVDEYEFDLTNLKEAFDEVYPNQEGKIDISIRENDETLERFLYEF